eukprot:SAG11_NODE_178_length_13331_cov_17.694906_7_plen_84_part_00
MAADKVRTIIDMPLPNGSATQIRGFLGMAGFNRKFISDFAGITRPLNDLLKKGVNVAKSWTKEQTTYRCGRVLQRNSPCRLRY